MSDLYIVTGAQGCIGSWVTKRLVEAGERCLVFDVDPQPRRLSVLLSPGDLPEIVAGDIRDLEQFCRLVHSRGVTRIIHLAGIMVPGCRKDPVGGALVNVVGTLNVFESARRLRSQVRQIAFASSVAVFGPEELYESGPVGEGVALHPRTHYGVYKQANEANARVFFDDEGISSIGLRPWAVYGVGRDQGLTSDPTRALKAAVLGRPFEIRFGGRIDLQYVADVADAFVRAAASDLQGARIYNLRGDVVPVPEIIATIERLVPPARGMITATGGALPFPPDMDDQQIQRDLSGLQRTTLQEGLRETRDLFETMLRQGRLEVDAEG